MGRHRRYSSPSIARKFVNQSFETDLAKLLAPVSSGTAAAPMAPSKHQESAEALARMTPELELRDVRSRTERLDRDLHILQIKMGHDKASREENGQRLGNLLTEMESFRVAMGDIQNGLMDLKGGNKRQERVPVVHNYQSELKDIKRGDQWFQSCVEGRQPSAWPNTEVDALRRVHASVPKEPKTPKDNTTVEIKRRIREGINSTRRWNREHKTSRLPDSQFVANYLRKQSQRDPAMAVHLQRSLQRRIRERDTLTGGTWSQPRNLDELCQRVSWKDVKDMVKDVLVDNEQRTTRLLNGAMMN